jgi:glycosyltransferase involved in cell wall biosynthesis
VKILLISRYFPPEIGTAANLFYELATALSKKRHDVTVTTNFPWYNLKEIPQKYKGKFFMREQLNGFSVIRLALPVPGPHKLKLAAGHATVPLTSAVSGLISGTPDIIYVYSPPLFMGITGWLLKVFKNVPFIMGVQDLHPQCYIDQNILKNPLAIWMLEALEKFCYRQSSAITVHSDGNKEHIVRQKSIPGQKVHVLHNWIDTEELQPLPRENTFSKKHNLCGKFVVGYAGTLGMSQGLMSVVEAAALLRDLKDIEFFIVGDGIEKEPMMRHANDLGLDNIRFLPMQPKTLYPLVVASCDVGLVTLNTRVKTPVVPSKILSLMAAGRPVLGSLPLHGDAPGLIREAGCGICIGPEDPEGLAREIVRLSDDTDLCQKFGQQGRQYVVREMSLDKTVTDLEELFERYRVTKN